LTRRVGIDNGEASPYNPGSSATYGAMGDLGKLLIISGVVLLVAGTVVAMVGRIPWLGRLPGDVVIRRENFVFYFPLASCVLVSVVISLLVYLFRR
jgi:hypothetical protein